MKKIIYLIFLFFIFSGFCFAKTYKIKSSGKVIYPTNSNIQTQNILYNNYNYQNYTNSNIVNQNGAYIIEIVMDFSGSMAGAIEIAKNTMSSVVSQIPGSVQLGLRVFGYDYDSDEKKIAKVQNVVKTIDKKGKVVYKLSTGKHKNNSGACSATKQVTPIKKANAQSLINGMNSIDLGGSTPLVLALEETVSVDFASFSRDSQKKIILITDGGENCGGNPCSFAKTLMSQRDDISVDVVLVGSNTRELKCLAQKTNGKIYKLSDVSQLPKALTTSINGVEEDNNQQKYEFIKF